MKITDEYLCLKELAQTKEGWKSIQTAWNQAIGRVKIKGNWIKVKASAGDSVEGFAIDSKSKKAFCGTRNDHSWAYNQLYNYLLDYEHEMEVPPDKQFDSDLEERIIRGWRGKILDFKNPCIFIAHSRFFSEPDFLKEIEESILEKGLGLPLSSLFLEKIR